jgi:hypothetical protein
MRNQNSGTLFYKYTEPFHDSWEILPVELWQVAVPLLSADFIWTKLSDDCCLRGHHKMSKETALAVSKVVLQTFWGNINILNQREFVEKLLLHLKWQVIYIANINGQACNVWHAAIHTLVVVVTHWSADWYIYVLAAHI